MARFIIYGAGAIGGTVGGHLALSGHDVALLARGAHAAAMKEHGLRFVTPAGVHTLRLPIFTHPREAALQPDDCVFLCMKGQHSEDALRDLKTAIDDIPVFCFQNGVRNEEIARRYFARVYGVMVRVGGGHLKPGEVIGMREPPGWLIIGCSPRGLDGTAEAAAAALSKATFAVKVSDDVMPYKWGKLMSNLANAISAATDGHDPEGRIARAVRAEAAGLLSEAGQRWITWDEVQREYAPFAEPERASIRGPMHGSTWQSLTRAQGSVEVEFLNGEIVRLAQRLGKEAPINAALARVVDEMARRRQAPGAYTPETLAAALGLPPAQ